MRRTPLLQTTLAIVCAIVVLAKCRVADGSDVDSVASDRGIDVVRRNYYRKDEEDSRGDVVERAGRRYRNLAVNTTDDRRRMRTGLGSIYSIMCALVVMCLPLVWMFFISTNLI